MVPTGAAGHLVGGMIAKKMGLPLLSIGAAVNRNDVLHRFLTSGRFVLANTYGTVAPAMVSAVLNSQPTPSLPTVVLSGFCKC